MKNLEILFNFKYVLRLIIGGMMRACSKMEDVHMVKHASCNTMEDNVTRKFSLFKAMDDKIFKIFV
jgi:hypothetical protein